MSTEANANVDVISEQIDLTDIMSQPLTVTIELPDGKKIGFHTVPSEVGKGEEKKHGQIANINAFPYHQQTIRGTFLLYAVKSKASKNAEVYEV